MLNKKEFKIEGEGYQRSYSLPVYGISSDLRMGKLTNAHGDRTVSIQFLTKERLGILHETVLAVLMEDANHRDGKVPSKYTEKYMYHLQEALNTLELRTKDREKRNVIFTDKE